MTVKPDKYGEVDAPPTGTFAATNPYGEVDAPTQVNIDAIPIANATEILEVPVVVQQPILAQAVKPVNPQVVGTGGAAVIHQSNMVRIRKDMGRESVFITCPYCNETGFTVINDKFDNGSFIWMACCCLMQCYICVIAPFCVKSMVEVEHKCRHCRKVVGRTKSFAD